MAWTDTKIDGTSLLTADEWNTHVGFHLPAGAILMWHGLIAAIPTGFLLCNGSNGTPDLRSRFIRGAPNATEAGTTGGSDTHTLITAEMPSHTHTDPYMSGATSTSGGSEGGANAGVTGATGGDGAHNNMPAYYEILFIMKS